MKRAIEFRKPDYIPMEIVDVPYIYNAYHTLDPNTVKFIPGTENFDMLWPCCYSWCHTATGKNPEGEILKEDQFGVKLKTPLDEKSTYMLQGHPLAGMDSLGKYKFPNPDVLLGANCSCPAKNEVIESGNCRRAGMITGLALQKCFTQVLP